MTTKRNSEPTAAITLSVLLIIGGLLVAVYFFFLYDTSVEVPSRYVYGVGTVGGGSVHNQGLMQNRLLGCGGGIAAIVIGTIMAVASSSRRPNAGQQMKPCSYCAELVQPNAKVCKHCGKNIEEISCPHCRTRLLRMPELVGMVGSCPKCNGAFTYA